MKTWHRINIPVDSIWFVEVIKVLTGESVDVEVTQTAGGKIVSYDYIATHEVADCVRFIAERMFPEV